MAKLTLSDLDSLVNQTSALNTINTNNALIEAALENTLSLDGTSPNSLGADLDMNGNQILNLPVPTTATEPIRKDQFDELVEDTTGVVTQAAAILADVEATAATVSDSEANAAASALAAQTAQSGAETAETNASASATSASTSASNAATSATNAATSETNASASATSAATSASNAATSETNAETAETNAVAAKVAAESARDSALAAQTATELAADTFDDVYLGSKANDPTLDNDGNALVEGQLYWNNTNNNLRVYDGSTWQAYSAASGITSLFDDTAPKLGGNLDLNSFDITGIGDVNITGTITGSGALAVPSIELGATDTTIARDSAGVISVEGVPVALNSTTSTHIVGSIEVGNATDTTITRSSSGVIAVEGINVALNTASQSHFCGSLELGNASDTTFTRTAAGRAAIEDSAILLANTEDQGPITGGSSVTPKDLGSKSSGTVTIDVADRSIQKYTNMGAHSLDIGTTNTGSTVVLITNGASSSTITTTAFDVVKGDSFTTTTGHVFRCVIEYWGSGQKWLFIERMV